MTNKIIPKKSIVPGKWPRTDELVQGEIAINLADRTIFSKDANGDVVKIGGASIPAYSSLVSYAPGDYVYYNEVIYRAIGNISPGATFPVVSPTLWAQVTPTKSPTTNPSNFYYRGDKVWATMSASAVGLGNVNNTSDANKPVSTAQQTALDTKADKVSTYTKTEVDTKLASNVTAEDVKLALKQNAINNWAAAEYKVGDIVLYGEALWRCVIEIKSPLDTLNKVPSDTYSKWDRLTANTADFYTKSEVFNKTETYSATVLDTKLALKADGANTYTKAEVDTIDNKKADKLTTYTKTEVDTALNTKADKTVMAADLALKADKTTTYTKTDIDGMLVNVYSKSEVDAVDSTKADKSTTYTKTETDSLLAQKQRNILAFSSTTAYSIGDIVVKDGVLYQANANFAASSTFPIGTTGNVWIQMTSTDFYTQTAADAKLAAKQNNIRTWVKADSYKTGDIVLYEMGDNAGRFFQAMTDIAGPQSFDPPQTSQWKLLSHGSTIRVWSKAATYQIHEIVVHQNALYRCIATISTGNLFDIGNTTYWERLAAGVNTFIANRMYEVGDIVSSLSQLYLCRVRHVSGASASSDGMEPGITTTNWQPLCVPVRYQIPTYSTASVSYKVGDVVTNNNQLYRCLVDHTSSTATRPTVDANNATWACLSAETASTIRTFGAGLIVNRIGELVVNDGQIYRSLKTFTGGTAWSDITDNTAFELIGKDSRINLGASSVYLWSSTPAYSKGDVVYTRDQLWVAESNIPAGTNFTTVLIGSGGVGFSPLTMVIDDYNSSRMYRAGEIVIDKGIMYRLTSGVFNPGVVRPSDRTVPFGTDLAGFWEPLSNVNSNITNFSTIKAYKIGDEVLYNGSYYRRVNGDQNASTTFTIVTPAQVKAGTAGWFKTTGVPAWEASVDYFVGDVVLYRNRYYNCTVAHTSTATFSIAAWSLLHDFRTNAFSTTANYLRGDEVIYEGKLWRANADIAASATFTKLNKLQVSAGSTGWHQVNTIEEYSNLAPYYIGDLVFKDGSIYRRVNTDIASGSASFTVVKSTDTTTGGWVRIGGDNIAAFDSSRVYQYGDIVLRDGDLWMAWNNVGTGVVTAGVSFDKLSPSMLATATKGWLLVSGTEEWQLARSYVPGQLVLKDNKLYTVRTAIAPNTAFKEYTAESPTGFTLVGSDAYTKEDADARFQNRFKLWTQALVDIKAGDVVIYNSSLYRAKVDMDKMEDAGNNLIVANKPDSVNSNWESVSRANAIYTQDIDPILDTALTIKQGDIWVKTRSAVDATYYKINFFVEGVGWISTDNPEGENRVYFRAFNQDPNNEPGITVRPGDLWVYTDGSVMKTWRLMGDVGPQGYWLEITNGSNVTHVTPDSSTAPLSAKKGDMWYSETGFSDGSLFRMNMGNNSWLSIGYAQPGSNLVNVVRRLPSLNSDGTGIAGGAIYADWNYNKFSEQCLDTEGGPYHAPMVRQWVKPALSTEGAVMSGRFNARFGERFQGFMRGLLRIKATGSTAPADFDLSILQGTSSDTAIINGLARNGSNTTMHELTGFQVGNKLTLNGNDIGMAAYNSDPGFKHISDANGNGHAKHYMKLESETTGPRLTEITSTVDKAWSAPDERSWAGYKFYALDFVNKQLAETGFGMNTDITVDYSLIRGATRNGSLITYSLKMVLEGRARADGSPTLTYGGMRLKTTVECVFVANKCEISGFSIANDPDKVTAGDMDFDRTEVDYIVHQHTMGSSSMPGTTEASLTKGIFQFFDDNQQLQPEASACQQANFIDFIEEGKFTSAANGFAGSFGGQINASFNVDTPFMLAFYSDYNAPSSNAKFDIETGSIFNVRSSLTGWSLNTSATAAQFETGADILKPRTELNPYGGNIVSFAPSMEQLTNLSTWTTKALGPATIGQRYTAKANTNIQVDYYLRGCATSGTAGDNERILLTFKYTFINMYNQEVEVRGTGYIVLSSGGLHVGPRYMTFVPTSTDLVDGGKRTVVYCEHKFI